MQALWSTHGKRRVFAAGRLIASMRLGIIN